MNRHIVTLVALTIVLPFNVMAAEEAEAPKFTPPTFADVDTDGVPGISLTELEAYRKTMQEQMGSEDGKQMNRRDSVSAFASFDKNKDGIIDEAEFAAHAKYSNPGNGTGELKAYKNNNKMNNSNKEKNENKGNGKSNGKGNSN